MSTYGEIVGYQYRAAEYCPNCIGAAMTPHGYNHVQSDDEPTEYMLDMLALAHGSIDRADESTFDSGDFPKVLTAEQVRDGYAEEGPDCCETCGRVLCALDVDGSGPGKFEGNGHACHLAAYLYGLSLEGFDSGSWSDAMGMGASATLIGDWVVMTDSAGFVSIEQADCADLDPEVMDALGLERPDTDTGPTLCPSCGRPITLLPTGWWTHDGLPNGCWRLSFDGPNID